MVSRLSSFLKSGLRCGLPESGSDRSTPSWGKTVRYRSRVGQGEPGQLGLRHLLGTILENEWETMREDLDLTDVKSLPPGSI